MSNLEIDLINKRIVDCNKCILCKLQFNDNSKNDLGHGKLLGKIGKSSNDIFMIGLNPSRIRYKGSGEYVFDDKIENDNSMGKFIKLLKELEMYDNLYMTNLVKCSTTNNVVDQSYMETCFENNLKLEIGIIKPKIIVAMGNDVYNFLKDKIKKIQKITHPSYYFSYNKGIVDNYKVELKRILEMIK